MDKKVHELLNQQINKEFYSAYLYLDFSNYFEDAGLDGFANWYKVQAQEERDHAMLFLKYLQMCGEKVSLGAIEITSVPHFSIIDDKAFSSAEVTDKYKAEFLSLLKLHRPNRY